MVYSLRTGVHLRLRETAIETLNPRAYTTWRLLAPELDTAVPFVAEGAFR